MTFTHQVTHLGCLADTIDHFLGANILEGILESSSEFTNSLSQRRGCVIIEPNMGMTGHTGGLRHWTISPPQGLSLISWALCVPSCPLDILGGGGGVYESPERPCCFHFKFYKVHNNLHSIWKHDLFGKSSPPFPIWNVLWWSRDGLPQIQIALYHRLFLSVTHVV